MLTIAGPFDGVPMAEDVTADYQRVAAYDFDSAPLWVENSYVHKGTEWPQRIYWAAEPNILVRYQSPANRVNELEQFRSAAVQIANGIRSERFST
jgi:hypothetical protein